jgi:hypothetical protein
VNISHPSSKEVHLKNKIILITAISGALLILLVTVLGGANFPNYNHATQFISELGAFGAPNAGMINLAGFLPAGLLIIIFTFFAWRSLPYSQGTTLGMFGLALFALGYIAAAFFPCEPGCRPSEPSLSQALHNLLGLAGYFTAPISLFFLGSAAHKWPNGTSLSTIGFIGSGLSLLGLLGMLSEFNYVGLAQRILEASVLVWIVACALYINRAVKD